MWKIIVLLILVGIALYFFIAKPGYSTESEKYVGLREAQSDRYPDVEEDGYERKTNDYSFTKYGFVPLILAALLLLFTSFTQVHAKEVGVGVSFGKPVAEYDAGVHFKPFWYSVTKINGTVYTDSYGTKGAGNAALPVRLGDGNPATAAVTLRWHINPEAVDYIYATYRSDDPAEQLRDAVVDTQLQAVVNTVFGEFNPTAVVQNVDINDPAQATRQLNFSPDYKATAQEISDQMDEAVKDADGLSLVIIDKVTVAGINYGTATEKNISALVQQAAKTQQAFLLKGTNKLLAEANNNLKSSLEGKNATFVIAQQCFRDLADGKIVNEPGFSCWPGSGSSVVIPGVSSK